MISNNSYYSSMNRFQNSPVNRTSYANVNRTQLQQILFVNGSQSGNIDSIFQKYDLDKNGTLSENEMKVLMKDYNIEYSDDKKDGNSFKNIADGIGSLLGGITNAAAGVFGMISAAKSGGEGGGAE